MKMTIREDSLGNTITEFEFKSVSEHMEYLRAMDIYSKVKEMEGNLNVMDPFNNRNGIN